MYLPESAYDGVSRTALAVCAYSAFVTRHEGYRAVYEDPYAEPLFRAAAREGQELMDDLSDWPAVVDFIDRHPTETLAMVTHVLWRKRWVMEKVTAALAKGIDQLVILGSGMDTLSMRIQANPGLRIFEIDQPRTIAAKQALTDSLFGIPERLIHVAVDFARETAAERLAEVGYDRTRPAVFVAEVVLEYIPPAAVDTVFATVGENEAQATQFVFTFFSTNLALGENFGQVTADAGEPILFTLPPDDLDDFLATRGFKSLDVLDRETYLPAIGMPLDSLPFDVPPPEEWLLHIVLAQAAR